MAEREQLEVDVLFVGGGPAGLAGAIHLARRLKQEKAKGGAGKLPAEPSIVVLEKSLDLVDSPQPPCTEQVERGSSLNECIGDPRSTRLSEILRA